MFKLVKLVKRTKRIGRGYGSGKGGHTVGRGQKGQKSRGKGKPGILQAGGQIPNYRKMPVMRGVRNKPVTQYTEVTIKDLLNRLKRYGKDVKVITPNVLLELGYKRAKDGFKIIGRLEEKVSIRFRGVRVSKGVRDSIR